MPSVYLWHIDSADPVAKITTQAEGWAAPSPVTVFRATHIPIGDDCSPLDHPARRTSLNVWVDMPIPQFPESFARDIREQCGDDPLWIGVHTCCQRPRFWLDVDENEELPEVPDA